MAYYNLQLGKLGSLVCREWSMEDMDFRNSEIFPENYLFHLDDTVCIKQGVTLKDIALLFKNDLELFSITTCCPYLDFLVECITEAPITKTDLYALEIKWKAVSDDQEKNGPFLYNFIECFGVGSDGIKPMSSFLLDQVSHLPIILNEEFAVCDSENNKVLFSSRRKYILGDLLKNIIFELALPVKDGMNVTFEEMVSNTVGELQNQYDEMVKGNPKPCKICGSDTRSFIFDKPSDVCDKCFIDNQDN